MPAQIVLILTKSDKLDRTYINLRLDKVVTRMAKGENYPPPTAYLDSYDI